jgi:hypothetical protein
MSTNWKRSKNRILKIEQKWVKVSTTCTDCHCWWQMALPATYCRSFGKICLFEMSNFVASTWTISIQTSRSPISKYKLPIVQKCTISSKCAWITIGGEKKNVPNCKLALWIHFRFVGQLLLNPKRLRLPLKMARAHLLDGLGNSGILVAKNLWPRFVSECGVHEQMSANTTPAVGGLDPDTVSPAPSLRWWYSGAYFSSLIASSIEL